MIGEGSISLREKNSLLNTHTFFSCTHSIVVAHVFFLSFFLFPPLLEKFDEAFFYQDKKGVVYNDVTQKYFDLFYNFYFVQNLKGEKKGQ